MYLHRLTNLEQLSPEVERKLTAQDQSMAGTTTSTPLLRPTSPPLPGTTSPPKQPKYYPTVVHALLAA